ncbi:hypothetical protein [Chitinophaga skermanii]|uniref:hypothetical protein n=1 Tax=Chitinophaga skermanii TaxID=331697 RepID=UPI0013144560|nr:hypothetical protein [Chitinophaga skermanii]
MAEKRPGLHDTAITVIDSPNRFCRNLSVVSMKGDAIDAVCSIENVTVYEQCLGVQ